MIKTMKLAILISMGLFVKCVKQWKNRKGRGFYSMQFQLCSTRLEQQKSGIEPILTRGNDILSQFHISCGVVEWNRKVLKCVKDEGLIAYSQFYFFHFFSLLRSIPLTFDYYFITISHFFHVPLQFLYTEQAHHEEKKKKYLYS